VTVPPPNNAEALVLPRTHLTLHDARSKLAGWHFSQEALSQGEREILYVAEAVLRYADELVALANRTEEAERAAEADRRRADTLQRDLRDVEAKIDRYKDALELADRYFTLEDERDRGEGGAGIYHAMRRAIRAASERAEEQ